jgi:hypothetical protein
MSLIQQALGGSRRGNYNNNLIGGTKATNFLADIKKNSKKIGSGIRPSSSSFVRTNMGEVSNNASLLKIMKA